MEDLEDKLGELLSECEDVTQPHVFPIAQEAVQIAELLGDDEFRLITHFTLLCACTVQGRMKEAVVELAWMLEHREHPLIDEWRDDFYSMAVHLLGSVSAMPDVPREQVLSIEQDVIEILSDYGVGDRSLMRIRCFTQLRLGNLDAAEGLWQRSQRIQPGGRWRHADVEPEYVAVWEMTRAWFQCDPAAAVAVAPKLARKPRTEEHQEMAFCAWAQMALLSYRGGDLKLAETACKMATKYFKGLPLYTGIFGEVTACLAFTGQLRKALKFTEAHALWGSDRGDGEDLLCLRAGAGIVLGVAAQKNANVKLRFPREFERYDKTGIYDAGALSEWYFSRARQMTDALDARNGNDAWTRLLEWRMELLQP